MPDTWVTVPRVGSGTKDDPHRPKYVPNISDIDGYAGTVRATAPQYLIRVYGTQAALDDLRANPDVTERGMDSVRQQLSDSATVTTDTPDESFSVKTS
jgi:hypothetical protein